MAELSSAEVNDLPDSAFAYIEPGGEKDEDGKTTPRKLRHFPIHDKPHVQNALARAPQSPFGDKAMPKIKAAAKKFGVEVSANDAELSESQEREDDPWEIIDQLTEEVTPSDPPMSPRGDTEGERNYAQPRQAFTDRVERSPAKTAQMQVRTAGENDDADKAWFTGYASVTGVGYEVRDWLGEYRETMAAGSFAKTLRETENVPMLYGHSDKMPPLASTGSGTSRLAEDGKGLRNDAELDRRDQNTNSVVIQLSRGVLTSMSFTFRAVQETWNDEYDDRTVREAQLYDTSIVVYPANPAATGELAEAMRDALGREGRSLWLADNELSMRTAMVDDIGRDCAEFDDLLERSLRALIHADEVVQSRLGPEGRARTFAVGRAMLQLRAGKVLSTANENLLTTAMAALSAGDKQHMALGVSHGKARDAVSGVLSSLTNVTPEQNNPEENDPVAPGDAAGPRSLPLAVAQSRLQVHRLRRY